MTEPLTDDFARAQFEARTPTFDLAAYRRSHVLGPYTPQSYDPDYVSDEEVAYLKSAEFKASQIALNERHLAEIKHEIRRELAMARQLRLDGMGPRTILASFNHALALTRSALFTLKALRKTKAELSTVAAARRLAVLCDEAAEKRPGAVEVRA